MDLLELAKHLRMMRVLRGEGFPILERAPRSDLYRNEEEVLRRALEAGFFADDDDHKDFWRNASEKVSSLLGFEVWSNGNGWRRGRRP